MKKTLTLGTILLGCCLVAVGQTSSSSGSSAAQGSQDQYSQGAMSADQNPSQAAKKTSLSGCLTRAADGNYMIADLSGSTFQLTGDTAQLSKYVGQEVRVEGIQSSSQAPGAMSSEQGAQQQFSVSRVHKVASTCRATGAATPSSTPGGAGPSY